MRSPGRMLVWDPECHSSDDGQAEKVKVSNSVKFQEEDRA